MHTHGSHGATDVTGFGPLGEAKKLVESQKNEVGFVLHTLPCIKESIKVDAAFSNGLAEGTSAETSGGLFIILPKDNAEAFLADIKAQEGWDSYVIGDVVAGPRTAKLADDVKIVEV